MPKPLILVVEDEPDMANSVAKTIEESGRYEAVIAHNGLEAFEVLKQNRRFLGLARNRVECIILDLKMPEMNGLQFLTRLRREEAQNKLMPVIILTAYEDDEKWTVATSPYSGLSAAYLKKDAPAAELIDTLDRVFMGELGYMIDETRQKKYQRLAELKEEEKKKNQAGPA